MTKKIPTAEDLALFRESVGTVRPVRRDKVLLVKHREKPRPFPKPAPVDPEELLPEIGDVDIAPVGREDTMSYAAPGTQKNVLKKLRKGHYGLDAAFDLHGMNSHEARQQLLLFLQRAVTKGYRCIHVVHGKGYRSSDPHPILKNHLSYWLRQHNNVLAFCSAPLRDGGAGALYVLLQVSANSE